MCARRYAVKGTCVVGVRVIHAHVQLMGQCTLSSGTRVSKGEGVYTGVIAHKQEYTLTTSYAMWFGSDIPSYPVTLFTHMYANDLEVSVENPRDTCSSVFKSGWTPT